MAAATVAIVTGSTRGIGLAIAEALALAGHAIVVNGPEAGPELDAAVTQVGATGATALGVVADVSDPASHERLVSAATGLGTLACCVNNAGVSVLDRGDLLDVTPASYDRCMAVNARGAFFLAQRAARAMCDQDAPANLHRSLVFITSVNAEAVSGERGEYCMSKAAASMATRLFALRLAADGIGAYEVRPGLVRTAMTKPATAKYDGLIAAGLVPQPRWGEPADIARVVAAVAAGHLRYTVGQAITVDGGLTLPRF